MKKAIFSIFFVVVLISSAFASNAKAASFNQSNLISNFDFTNVNSMSTSEIQFFLQNRNSYLKDFSEGGRSAAQIIHEASHGHGDASGSINGITVNSSTGTVAPGVILATLQKEQSLISRTTRDTNAINKAMGYACPDSGSCNPSYLGFTKQVESGAWQLRYNYERAQGKGFSNFQVGQSFNYDGDIGTFSNRATASLYRYTPHVYNGNYNFWNLFHNTYQFQTAAFAYRFVKQNGYPGLTNGWSYRFVLIVKNTGSATWNRNVVHLGTSHDKDRVSPFTRESRTGTPSGWTSPNRIKMQESSVAPGQYANFVFHMRNDGLPSGTYREHFQLVADGVGWMQDYGIYWDVSAI